MSKKTEYVTLAEAARHVGVSNLRQYKKIYTTFPAVVVCDHCDSDLGYDLAEVIDWYKTTVNRRAV